MGRGNFEGKGCPIVKYRDTLRSTVQKRLRRSNAAWVVGSKGPKESCVRWGSSGAERRCYMATSFGTQFAITGFV